MTFYGRIFSVTQRASVALPIPRRVCRSMLPASEDTGVQNDIFPFIIIVIR